MSQTYALHPIRTEADYEAALKLVEPYFDIAPEPDPDSAAGAHFEALVTLIDAYEAKHFPADPPDAVEAIKFRMEQQGLTARDLEPMIGSRGRVSEVLNRKRPLSMAMVWRLHEGLGIAAESLIRPPRKASR
ncbi:MAG TPA: helix-turn-helix domain-containing protein [Burkholderiaceae bacterium]|nr:helix-turn-helix domain-containing protein [Burkholderiaceae bacterium]